MDRRASRAGEQVCANVGRVKRSLTVVLGAIAACSGGAAPVPAGPSSIAPPTGPAEAWTTPAGWKSETIPFPLEFAPALAHRGVEELRFAPGFFDPAATGYWSYTFVWRTDDAAALDAPALAGELTTYFRGLLAAVDAGKRITAPETIVVHAEPDAAPGRFRLTAHVIDAFKTFAPVELAGWAERRACGDGAVWRFVLAPAGTTLRGELDTLAQAAACGQRAR
jgi:hypothetical protein